MSIRIVTDSSCDLPNDVAEQHQIGIVPLTIRFGDEEFIDRHELTPGDFWARCTATDTLPETAAPAPGLFENMYADLADDGATGVVVITLSGELSATKQSAELAARAVADRIPIRIVDSRSVSLGVGSMALAASKLAQGGSTIDEVESYVQSLITRTKVFGALDTLDNLKKGGRIGGARALLATALSIKPIIEVVDGAVGQAGKQRTRTKALKFLVDKIADQSNQIENLAVLHADCSDVDQFVDMLRPYHCGEIVVGEIGPVVGTHAGRGTIGVAYSLAG